MYGNRIGVRKKEGLRQDREGRRESGDEEAWGCKMLRGDLERSGGWEQKGGGQPK